MTTITAEWVMRGAVPGILVDELLAIRRGAFHDVGVFWHDTYREKHFTSAGATEYGYKPRKGERGNPDKTGFRRSYTGLKLKKYGHTRPLEYSGYSKLLTKIRDVRTTSNRTRTTTRVVMHSPGFRRKNPHSEINMIEEMITISPREEVDMTRRVGDGLMTRIHRVNKTKRLTAQ